MFSVTHVVTRSIIQWVRLSITPRTTHDLLMKKCLASPTTYEATTVAVDNQAPRGLVLRLTSRHERQGQRLRRAKDEQAEHGAGGSIMLPSIIISRLAAPTRTTRACPVAPPRLRGTAPSPSVNRSCEHSTDVRETQQMTCRGSVFSHRINRWEAPPLPASLPGGWSDPIELAAVETR